MRARTVIALTVLALLLRLAVIIPTFDGHADGRTRAKHGYLWASHPSVVTHGVWLPGFLYLSGAAELLWPEPRYAPRLLSAILGAASVPVAAALAARAVGHPAALATAAMLAIMPIHVGLSASSMSEVCTLFFLLLGILQTVRAAETPGRIVWLLAAASLEYAAMCRHEVWLLLPLFPLYLLLMTRRIGRPAAMGVLLAVGPAFWTLGNYLAESGAFVGFAGPLEGFRYAVGISDGLSIMLERVVANLGPIVFALGVVAIVREAHAAVGSRACGARALVTLVCAVFWLAMAAFAPVRGISLEARFLLPGFVLLLPFAADVACRLLPICRQRPVAAVTLGLLLGTTMWVSVLIARADLYVRRDAPLEMIAVANWLRTSPHQHDAVVLTQMHWESTFLAVFYPELSERQLIVAADTPDDRVQAFLRRSKPRLLVTCDEDRDIRERLLTLAGRELQVGPVVYRERWVEVVELSWRVHPRNGDLLRQKSSHSADRRSGSCGSRIAAWRP